MLELIRMIAKIRHILVACLNYHNTLSKCDAFEREFRDHHAMEALKLVRQLKYGFRIAKN